MTVWMFRRFKYFLLLILQEKMKSKNKLVPRLLGITKESVMRVDERTKDVVQEWPLTTVKRWAASPKSFTLVRCTWHHWWSLQSWILFCTRFFFSWAEIRCVAVAIKQSPCCLGCLSFQSLMHFSYWTDAFVFSFNIPALCQHSESMSNIDLILQIWSKHSLY